MGLIDQLVQLILSGGLLPLALVLGSVLLGLPDGPVDVLLGQVRRGCDGDSLLLTGAQVLGGDVDDAVGVDVEGDLDLRHAPGRPADARQLELAQGLVVPGHLPLALEHVDLHGGLEVLGRGENLALGDGQGGVPVDEPGADAAQSLDAQRQGRHIQQQKSRHLARQDTALQSRAHGHALIRVDALEGVLAREALDRLLDRRDAAGAAHHQHLAEIGALEARVGQGLLNRAHGLVHQMARQLVEFGPGQSHVHVDRSLRSHCQIGQIHGGGGHAGQLDLGLFRRLPDPLHGRRVLPQVHAGLLFELLQQVVHHALVEVIAAQPVVASGSQDLDDSAVNVQNGHVKGAAAQVVDHDLLGVLLVHAVGQGRSGGLVDDALHLQARDLACVLGGLALGIGKVGGDGNDRRIHGIAQIGLRVGLELLEDHGGDLLGRVPFAVDLYGVVRAHLPLDGGDGPVRVGDGLALGRLAHKALAGLGKAHHGGCGPAALSVRDHHHLAALHDGHAGICRTQVDTDTF